MFTILGIVFVFGYIAIALEHTIKIDKAASALFTAVICWLFLLLGKSLLFPEMGVEAGHLLNERLIEHLGDISGILFFLLGAMTIVELADAHDGFSIITDKITARKKSYLLIVLSIITFFMSAALDNLTTAIVMATLLRKLIHDKKDLFLFAGVIIIAANAGGAWSPIGDVTTIMLWIGGQVSTTSIVGRLLLPSMVCLAVPLTIMAFRLKGNLQLNKNVMNHEQVEIDIPFKEKQIVLALGLGALLFVLIFKTLTHLPPFMGVLFGLSVLWATTELMHKRKEQKTRESLSIAKVLERVDTSSILFFLGILLAVAALQSSGMLRMFAQFLDKSIGDVWVINILIGLLSSIVDNVPLVAGAMGMYDLSVYPQDDIFWELLAYCAGTGGVA